MLKLSPGAIAVTATAPLLTAPIGSAPVFVVAPSISPQSGPAGTVFTLSEGSAAGTPAPVLSLVLTLDGADVTGDVSGMSYTGPAAGGTLVLTVTAQNALGSVQAQASATVSAAGAITFGALTPVGEGGAAISEADGTYGQFTVAAGVITPNASPLTPGDTTVGGTTVTVEAGNVTHAADWTQAQRYIDGTRDWSAGGTIYLRPGLYDTSGYSFLGTQTGMGTTVWAAADPFDRPVLRGWSWNALSPTVFSAATFRDLAFERAQGTSHRYLYLNGITSTSLIYCRNNNVTLDGITFDGCTFRYTNLVPTWEGGLLIDGGAGIYLDNNDPARCVNLTVKNCTFEDIKDGISVNAGSGTFSGNTFRRLHGDAFNFTAVTTDVVIEKNLETDQGGDPLRFHQDFLQVLQGTPGLTRATIRGNTATAGANGKRLFGQADSASLPSGFNAALTGTVTLDASHTATDLQCDDTGGSFTVTLPDAASSDGMVFCLRKAVTSANAVTLAFSGADTWAGGAAPVLSANLDEATFVSDGTSQWRRLRPGTLWYEFETEHSRTLLAAEDQKVSHIYTPDGNVSCALPAGTASEAFTIRRGWTANAATTTATVTAPAGQSFTYEGTAGVTSIDLEVGQGIRATYQGANVWEVLERVPAMQGLFSNNPLFDSEVSGNAFSILSASGLSFEGTGSGNDVFNNTFLTNQRPNQRVQRSCNINADGTYRIANNIVQTAVNASNGATKYNNTELGLSSASDADLAPVFAVLAASSVADLQPQTRDEVFTAARIASGGALDDGALHGSTGTTTSNGFWDVSAEAVNTALPAPAVMAYEPAVGANTGVSGPYVVTFDQFVAAGAGNVTILNLTDGTVHETIAIADCALSGRQLAITPAAALTDGKLYALRIDAAAIVSLFYGTGFAGIADDSWQFTADAALIAAYPQVAADGTAIIANPAISQPGGAKKKFVWAYRGRPRDDASTSFFTVMGVNHGGSLVAVLELRDTGDVYVQGASSPLCRALFQGPGLSLDGSEVTIFAAVDTTQAAVADGIRIWVNGVAGSLQASTAWSQNATLGIDGNSVTVSGNPVYSGRDLVDDGLQMVFFDMLDDAAALPDFSDGAVRDKFLAPNLSDYDAQGWPAASPTGKPPLVAIWGAASQWNAGANRGTGGDFTTLTGSFTDV